MKRFLCVYAFIFILMMGLSSCSFPKFSLPFSPGTMYVSPSETQQVKTVEKTILDTINTRNMSSVKKLFSKKAIAKIGNVDEKLNEFYTFYSGDFVSSKVSDSVEDEYNGGNDRKSIHLWFTVKTNKDTYVIGCSDVISNPKDPSDVGAFQLYIVREEDMSSAVGLYGSGQDRIAIQCFY
ncbi:DUF5104 domain-containing protein [Ethanoligenens sp.]|uniref:DUF5104 domain-containing protein n=1 Tax=Ethanoligenens sp. TaxID=2099655 RepID=UPI0039ECD965